MTKASDNPFPSLLVQEAATDGSDFANAPADYRRLFLGEDGLLHLKDSAGTVTDISGSSVADILDLPTAETDDALVLAPDGAGGVAFRAEAGGGGGGRAPLDSYTLDGTYGDDFTAASLSGIWTRRNFTSGAETHRIGQAASTMRLVMTGRAAGDGYYQAAPAGDWEFAMSFTARYGGNPPLWGIACVNSVGTGVATAFANSGGICFIVGAVTTYSTYGSSFTQTPATGALTITSAEERKVWHRLRKTGTNYYGSYSLNGETWSPETPAFSSAITVDRVGMIWHPISGMVAGAVLDIDLFNKIA